MARYILAALPLDALAVNEEKAAGGRVVTAPTNGAAAGLTEVLGGSPAQVENAAEIAMEHNLGLTCDPVGGLVQIPCIERNAHGRGEGDRRVTPGPARLRRARGLAG